ncbi:MAG TPA: NAD-dependent epimerase/dehydratase family protein [Gaiellales bacterium]|jgi:UDP-glucose 4-epimerase|nr:NAD-dependent epimerase/dehydratase family protein [Gaiellales bacterium]
MPSALVTGGAGFIGSTLTRLLLERGYDVRVFDDLSSGSRDHLDGLDVELVTGDVRDLDALTAVAAGADAMFHLAAGAGVVDSIERPIENFDLNARGTLLALWAARESGVGRFVFSSSNAPLGDNAYPASEDKPLAPLSPYGAGKATGEAYCSAFYGAYGLDAVAVRFSNAYGPRSGRKTNVIPLFIRRIMAGEPLTIYGDGTQTRDFVYVSDLANGLIRAAEADGVGGEVFQLASGVETSLNDLVRMLGEVSGTSPEVRHEPPRAGEIQRNYSLIEKARSRLGHAPEVPLADGLSRTWDWFQQAS